MNKITFAQKIFLLLYLAIFITTAHANNTLATSQLQKLLDATIAEYSATPGAALFVSTPTLGTITVTTGYAQKETKTPILTSNNFRIASMSKTFLAVVVLKLIEQGKLQLDENISTLLPATIDIKRIPNGDKVTIRQLLQMRSGIPNYTSYNAYLNKIGKQPDHDWTPAEAIEIIYDQAPTFSPGASYEYSNTNYLLLQSIVEHLTGTTLGAQLRKYIFNPLSLNNTYMEVQEKKSGGFNGLITHGYDVINKKITDVTTLNDGFGLGDGAIISTTEDMGVFVKALLENKSLLSDKSLQQMLQMSDDYGLGIWREEIGNESTWAHSGSSSGFSGEYYYFPDKKLTVVILTNYANSEFFNEMVASTIDILNLQ